LGELKNRKHLNITIPINLIDRIKELSDQTRIPISKLAEEAWEDLLVKFENNKKIPRK